jgi:hypothetical protein
MLQFWQHVHCQQDPPSSTVDKQNKKRFLCSETPYKKMLIVIKSAEHKCHQIKK